MEVDLLGHLARERAGLGGVEGQAHLEEHVLQAHDAQAHGAPAQVGALGGGDGVVVQVDDPVELPHRGARRLTQLLPVERHPARVIRERVAREVDGAQVADGRLLVVRHLEDLGAQVGQVHDAAGHRGLVAGLVRLVLERHPPVARLGERPHHASVELAGLERPRREPLGLGLEVGALELLAVQVRQVGDALGVEQGPGAIGLHALHEEVRHPVGQVQVVGAPRLVAGVVAQLEELLQVRVPRLQVHAARALALAALVHRRHGRVQRLEPRDDAVAVAVGAGDERAARAHAVVGEPDAARELREHGHVGVALVDGAEVVLGRVEQEAGGELLVLGARVEEGGGAGHVLEQGESPVELQGLGHGLPERHRDAHEEVLGRLQYGARGGVLEQVAVVDGAQAEVLEEAVARGVDGVVELARVGGDELGDALVDQAQAVPGGDGLREGMHFLSRQLLVDVRGEQPRREPGVLGLLQRERGRGLDGELIQLLGGRSIIETGDRLGGHADGVHLPQAVTAAADGADDLVQVRALERPIALAHPHGGGRGRRGRRGLDVARVQHGAAFLLRDRGETRGGAGGRPGACVSPWDGSPGRPRAPSGGWSTTREHDGTGTHAEPRGVSDRSPPPR